MIGLFKWCNRTAGQLDPGTDFEFDPQKRTTWLTEEGVRKTTMLAKPVLLDTIDMETVYKYVERAVTAHCGYRRDRDYIVEKDCVVIVDEGTGRKMEGRKWQDGLHQIIESRENVPVTCPTGSAAQITIQSFYRRYEHLAGMTGTASQAASELRKIFSLNVSVIPTNKPCRRQTWPCRIFVDQASKRNAIAQSVKKELARGRSILIGTPSVTTSHGVSQVLDQFEIVHTVLNAHRHDVEAEIIKSAGKKGAVTIATNMAGRGTDILLDDDVREAGRTACHCNRVSFIAAY